MYIAYTDGSCKPNPGIGGWGVIILDSEGHIFCFANGARPDVTNNQMELVSVIGALAAIPEGEEVKVFSDSQYVINTMTKGWKKNKNITYWDCLEKIITERKLKVIWQWVKGHAGDEYNEKVDALAQRAADDYKESINNG